MATKPPTSLENGSFIHDLHTWKKKRVIFRSHVDFPWGVDPIISKLVPFPNVRLSLDNNNLLGPWHCCAICWNRSPENGMDPWNAATTLWINPLAKKQHLSTFMTGISWDFFECFCCIKEKTKGIDLFTTIHQSKFMWPTSTKTRCFAPRAWSTSLPGSRLRCWRRPLHHLRLEQKSRLNASLLGPLGESEDLMKKSKAKPRFLDISRPITSNGQVHNLFRNLFSLTLIRTWKILKGCG